jgi:hypothetical protein
LSPPPHAHHDDKTTSLCLDIRHVRVARPVVKRERALARRHPRRNAAPRARVIE